MKQGTIRYLWALKLKKCSDDLKKKNSLSSDKYSVDGRHWVFHLHSPKTVSIMGLLNKNLRKGVILVTFSDFSSIRAGKLHYLVSKSNTIFYAKSL